MSLSNLNSEINSTGLQLEKNNSNGNNTDIENVTDTDTNLISQFTEIKLDSSKFISISAERLKQLEDIERNLPAMIQSAIEQNKKDKLKLLHEKDKLDPKSVNMRVKRYAQKHKDEINAKRRLKRNEKKNLENNTLENNTAPVVSVEAVVKTQKPSRKKTDVLIQSTEATNENLTVRFDD